MDDFNLGLLAGALIVGGIAIAASVMDREPESAGRVGPDRCPCAKCRARRGARKSDALDALRLALLEYQSAENAERDAAEAVERARSIVTNAEG